eukprot:gene9985-6968_t
MPSSRTTLPPPPEVHCIGPESPDAGLAPGCAGCPNASLCASGAARQADPDLPALHQNLMGVRTVLLVLSGKGGVGKSTLSKELAMGLADRGYQVGLLDADLCGPSQPRLTGARLESVHSTSTGMEPVWLKSNLALMSSYFLSGAEEKNEALLLRGPKKNAMLKLFLKDVHWGSLDCLVIDTPPGTSDEHLTLVNLLKVPTTDGASVSSRISGAVVVTTPQRVAEADVRRELSFCCKAGIPVLGIVENMSGFVCPACHRPSSLFTQPSPTAAPPSTAGDRLAAEFNVPLLGRVPVDPLLMKSCEMGTSLLDYLAEIAEEEEEEAGALQQAVAHQTQSVEAVFALVDQIVPTLTFSSILYRVYDSFSYWGRAYDLCRWTLFPPLRCDGSDTIAALFALRTPLQPSSLHRLSPPPSIFSTHVTRPYLGLKATLNREKQDLLSRFPNWPPPSLSTPPKGPDLAALTLDSDVGPNRTKSLLISALQECVEEGADVVQVVPGCSILRPLLSGFILRGFLKLVQRTPVDLQLLKKFVLLLHRVLTHVKAHPDDNIDWRCRDASGLEPISYAASLGTLGVWVQVLFREAALACFLSGRPGRSHLIPISYPVDMDDWNCLTAEERECFIICDTARKRSWPGHFNFWERERERERERSLALLSRYAEWSSVNRLYLNSFLFLQTTTIMKHNMHIYMRIPIPVTQFFEALGKICVVQTGGWRNSGVKGMDYSYYTQLGAVWWFVPESLADPGNQFLV